MTLKELLAKIAAGEDITAADRELLLTYFADRREAAGDEPTVAQAEELESILDAVDAVNEALGDDVDALLEETADTTDGEGETDESDEIDDSAGTETDEVDEVDEIDEGTGSTDEGDDAPDVSDIDARAEDLVAASAKQAKAKRAAAVKRRKQAKLGDVRSNPGGAQTGTSKAPQFIAAEKTTVSPAGKPLVGDDLGRAFHQAALVAQQLGKGQRAYVAHMDVADSLAVAPESERSAGAYRAALKASIARKIAMRKEQLAIQASGGPCAAPETDYTRVILGGTNAGQFAAKHPGVVTTRPHQFYAPTPIDVTATSDGVGRVTASQDAAGYGDPDADPSTVPEGGAPYKSCVQADCPDPVGCEMAAIYMCVSIGRFMEMSFPEQVEAFKQQTAIYHALLRDTAFSDAYIAAATTGGGSLLQVSAAQFGASRDILSAIRRATAPIRSRRGDEDLMFEVYAPSWLKNPIASDLAKSFTNTADLRLPTQQVLGMLGQDEGIVLDTYSHDIGTTADGSESVLPDLTALAAEAELPAWPDQARLLIAPVGAVARNTGPTVSFGVESLGMNTNDTRTFQEQFEAPCVIDPSAVVVLDVPVTELGFVGAMFDPTA